MDTFGFQTRILMGDGMELLAQRYKRVFIVTDAFMEKSGKVSYITDRLSRHGAEFRIFSEIASDPDIDMVAKGVGHILEFTPDAVLAFGGGSPIDAAKAIVYFAGRQADLRDVPFIAVPTTSGTGSEVSRFAVITDRAKGVKYPLIDDCLLPNYAVLDAALTASVPPAVTADTGMDVFTHAVEAYVSTTRNDFTDAMAEKAIHLVRAHLETVFTHPEDLNARQEMHNASCLAGIAFSNSGLGLNHGMAHALGARFHIPHGRANAIALPYVMAFNAGLTGTLQPACARYAQIAGMVGLEAVNTRQGAASLVSFTRRFVEKLKIPATLRAAGVDEREFEQALPDMAAAALADRCTATNPTPCTVEEVTHLFRSVYTGK